MHAVMPRNLPAPRPKRRWWRMPLVALVFVLSVTVVSRTGRAETGESAPQELSVCLDWNPGPRGCPTAKQTETAVADILGRPTFSAPPCWLMVRGGARRLEKGGWEANLSFARDTGEPLGDRNLTSHAASCSALKDPVSLVIALMVEASASHSTLQVPSAEPTAGRGSSISASFALTSGLLPKLAYGATVDWEADLTGWLALQFQSSFFFPNSVAHASRGGEFWAWVAGAGVCPRVLSTSIVESLVCVGGRAGILRGVGTGLTHTGSATKPYGDAEAHVRLSFSLLGSLAAFTQFGLAVPWLRAQFVYHDAADMSVTVHQPQAAVFFAGAGIELRSGDRGPARTTSQ